MKKKFMQVSARIALIYWIISSLWILFSDRALMLFASRPNAMVEFSTYKGWAFVTVTAVLLYIAMRKQLHQWQVESERRGNAERTNKESEERFRQLFNAAPVGISDISADRRFIRCNPMLEKVLGYRENELRTMSIDDVTHPEDRENNASLFRNLIEGKIRTGSIEKRYIRKDGRIVWVALTSSGVYDEKGHFQYAVSITEDITRRKQADKKNERLNKIYETMSSINQMIAYVQDQQKLLDEVCRIAVEVGKFRLVWIGIADEKSGEIKPAAHFGDNEGDLEILKMSFAKGGHGDKGEIETRLGEGEYIIRNDIQHSGMLPPWSFNALKRGFRSFAAFPLRRKERTYGIIYLYSSEAGIFDELEEILLLELSADITHAVENIEQEQQHKALQKDRDLMFNYSIDMLCVAGFDGYLKQLNPSWTKTLGWTEEELTRAPYLNFLHEEDRRVMAEATSAMAEFESAVSIENRFLCKDGSYKWLSWNCFALAEEHLIFAVLRDVTGQKLSEKRRESLEAQLIQAQKLESLGTLAGGIAHDFNNILAIIMGYASILEKTGTESDRIMKGADAIRKAAERGAGVVKQLLTIARKTETNLEQVHINDMVNEVSRLLEETLPKTINLITDLRPNLPYILADVAQIHQVLLNLCINARDAMPEGGVVRLTTGILDCETVISKFPNALRREHILLQVADNGMGMSEEIKQRIFDPFFTTKDIGKGTGLGLALVHSIVTNHGGFIDVQTRPGSGTTFNIYLPAQERNEAQEEEITAGSLQDIPGGTETILLIEDEKMLRELAKDVVGSKGYNVLVAEDGERGIELFMHRKDEIAAVISDLGLPKIPGDEVLRRIRSLDPSARLIAASGFIEPEVKLKLLSLNVTHFVQKPYLPSEILQTIRDAIDVKEPRPW